MGLSEYKTITTGFVDDFPAEAPVNIVDQFASADGARIVTRFHSRQRRANDYFVSRPRTASFCSMKRMSPALRGLVDALASELAPEGIHAATITIAGTVAPGTACDPDSFANMYWEIHNQRRDHRETERVFNV